MPDEGYPYIRPLGLLKPAIGEYVWEGRRLLWYSSDGRIISEISPSDRIYSEAEIRSQQEALRLAVEKDKMARDPNLAPSGEILVPTSVYNVFDLQLRLPGDVSEYFSYWDISYHLKDEDGPTGIKFKYLYDDLPDSWHMNNKYDGETPDVKIIEVGIETIVSVNGNGALRYYGSDFVFKGDLVTANPALPKSNFMWRELYLYPAPSGQLSRGGVDQAMRPYSEGFINIPSYLYGGPTGEDLIVKNISDFGLPMSAVVRFRAANRQNWAVTKRFNANYFRSTYIETPAPSAHAELPLPNIALSPDVLYVDEGGSNFFTVVLTSKPSADINVSVARMSGDTSLTVPYVNLTFTAENWHVPQSVTVSAAEDADTTDGDAYFIATAIGTAHLRNFSVSKTIRAVELDNDDVGTSTATPDIVLSVQNLYHNYPGTSSFNVRLNAKPVSSHTVNITKTSGDASLTLSSTSLLFNSSNWNIPQVVNITGSADNNPLGTSMTFALSATGLVSKSIRIVTFGQYVPPPASSTPQPNPSSIIENSLLLGPVWPSTKVDVGSASHIYTDNVKYVGASDGSRMDISFTVLINEGRGKYSSFLPEWNPSINALQPRDSRMLKYRVSVYDNFGNEGYLGWDFSYSENFRGEWIFFEVFPTDVKKTFDIVWPPPYIYDTEIGKRIRTMEFGKSGGFTIQIRVDGNYYKIPLIQRSPEQQRIWDFYVQKAAWEKLQLSQNKPTWAADRGKDVIPKTINRPQRKSFKEDIESIDLGNIKDASSLEAAKRFVTRQKAARTPRMRTL